MTRHALYAIYKNGKPLDSSVGVVRNAFDRKGSAEGILNRLIDREVRRELREKAGAMYYLEPNPELTMKVKEQVRQNYHIKTFLPEEVRLDEQGG